MKAHLQTCTLCREKFAVWQEASARLSDWKLHPARAGVFVRTAVPVLKWGLAALIVLGLGYGIGRFSAPEANVEAIRAAIEQPLRESLRAELREQLREEFRADWQASTDETHRLWLEFAETYSANRQQDQLATLTLFDRAQRERQAEHLDLRRALETIAVVADDKFQRAELGLSQLAHYTQAQFVPAGPDSYQPINRSNPKGN